jgi:hypothetical protein
MCGEICGCTTKVEGKPECPVYGCEYGTGREKCCICHGGTPCNRCDQAHRSHWVTIFERPVHFKSEAHGTQFSEIASLRARIIDLEIGMKNLSELVRTMMPKK